MSDSRGDLNPLSTQDAVADAGTAKREGATVIVVDDYAATPEYLDGLAGNGLKVGVIDDLADRDLRAAGWILNQNLGADRLEYSVGPDRTLLLGPTWALLRSEFAEVRAESAREPADGGRRVLITLGGGGAEDVTKATIAALDAVRAPLDIEVVVGSRGRDPESLEMVARRSAHDVAIHVGVTNMAARMAQADISVNAGGSTCWELLCLGVPMVVMALSANQRPTTDALSREMLAVVVEAQDPAGIATGVEDLLEDPRRRCELRRRGMDLIDGRGADRAARSVSSFAGF
jgi:spore coat polysaccharide biosynthesis predicted glycosyltransferase SpsG